MYNSRIIHLSDLHFEDINEDKRVHVFESDAEEAKRNVQIEQHKKIRDLLVESVKKLTDELKFHKTYVVLTGDLAYHGTRKEYAMVKKFLTDLKRQIHYKDAFFCPGNHDLRRPTYLRDFFELQYIGIRTEDSAAVETVENMVRNEHERRFLMKSMQEYYKFADKETKKAPRNRKTELYRVYRILEGNLKVNVISLNSSFLYHKQLPYYGYLTEDQVHRAFGTVHEGKTGDSKEFNIILLHHPLEAQLSAKRAEITECFNENAHLILAGHDHFF